jgi:transposase
VLDVSWSALRNMIQYKCDHAGVMFLEVDENLTTQTCSRCGSVNGPKGREGLSIRRWECSKCGAVHDRDSNAAINIARLGCEVLGLQ